MSIDNNDLLPSRCLESAAEEDISIVALLAPISSKQMHLSLFTISPILPLTTHRRQVINAEEEQFIFIACNHSKHPHGLAVPLSQVGRKPNNTSSHPSPAPPPLPTDDVYNFRLSDSVSPGNRVKFTALGFVLLSVKVAKGGISPFTQQVRRCTG